MSANREIVPSGEEWDAEQLRNLTDADLTEEITRRMQRVEAADHREPTYIPPEVYFRNPAFARVLAESYRREQRDE